MTLEDWIDKVLEENRLDEIVDCFESSEEQWTYVDRHIVHSASEIPHFEGLTAHQAGCLCGIRLFGKWQKSVKTNARKEVVISSPILVIDIQWLNGEENAAPPHVYVALAQDRQHLPQIDWDDYGEDGTELFPFISDLQSHSEPGKIIKARDQNGVFSAWIVYGRGS